ncbi:parathyroid hormone-like hormone a isoform X2 [Syngnathus acus]|nr:parathyroid hormone-like hormone a isoform X2 [Syngnathus acus]
MRTDEAEDASSKQALIRPLPPPHPPAARLRPTPGRPPAGPGAARGIPASAQHLEASARTHAVHSSRHATRKRRRPSSGILLRDLFPWNFSLPLFCFEIVTPSVHRGNKRAVNMSGVGALLLAAFLLCSPVAGRARPADARTRRSVTHAQLMHDKGRTLQDFKRRLWLQELLDEVHTAEIRQLPLSKAPPAPSKGLAADWSPEEREATNLPQETHKSFRDAKRRKKGRPGRRKDADKRKRRAQAKPL